MEGQMIRRADVQARANRYLALTISLLSSFVVLPACGSGNEAAPPTPPQEPIVEFVPPPTPEAVTRLLRPSSRCRRAEVCNRRGLAQYRRDNYEEALKFFAAALILEPGHEKAAFNAACMFAKLGETEGALHMMRSVLAMGTDASRGRIDRVARDGDFDGIRSEPAFVTEMTRIRAAAVAQAASLAASAADAEAVNTELMIAVRRQIKAGDIEALAARAPEGERIEISYRVGEDCCGSGLRSRRRVSRGGENFAEWLREAKRSWRPACVDGIDIDTGRPIPGCTWNGLTILMNAQCEGECCSHSQRSEARAVGDHETPLFLEEICFAPQADTNMRRISSIEFSANPCPRGCAD